ncbi:MAG: TolC family protein, partial [Comamonas sp.]
MNKTLLPVALAGVLLVSGCSFIPTLDRPAAPVAEHFPAANEQAGAVAAADTPWQQFFTDPRLQQVINLALENNRDLRVAVLNIEKARAQYQIQRAAQFPEFGVAGTGSRQPNTATGNYANTYMAGLSMPSWE